MFLRRSAQGTKAVTSARPTTQLTTTVEVNMVPCSCLAAGIDEMP